MFHFTPPSSPRAADKDRHRPFVPSDQTIASAEFADPASSAFAAAILDPRTGQPLAPPLLPPTLRGDRAEKGEGEGTRRRDGGGVDTPSPVLDPTFAIPLGGSSFPSPRPPPPSSPRDRPSLPELQARPAAYSPTAERGRPVLSRHALEGAAYQPAMGGGREVEVEQEKGKEPVVEGRQRAATLGEKPVAKKGEEHEEVGSLNGLGRDVLASTPAPPPPPPAQNGTASTSKPTVPPRPAPPRHAQTAPPQPPIIAPRVASPLSFGPALSAPFVQPSHLPPLASGQTGPTAMQNWDVSGEMEFMLAKVVKAEIVNEVLEDSDALRKLREYIETKGSDPLLLDLYNDLKHFSDLSAHLRLASSSILQTYLLKSSPSRLILPISLRGPILSSLTQSISLNLDLLPPLQELLTRLFEREFKPYLQQKLVEHAVGRLGSWKAGYGWTGASTAAAPNMVSDGLADSYCLTNPRLKDNPIVLASQGFAQLTGYPLDSIISRNCRFLQGPGTAPESTLRLRAALNAGEGITSLLLNYRADGTPFYNLLCMLPLKDSTGAVKYFLGGQIDVTGAISSFSSLALPAFASSAPPGSAASLPQPNGPTGISSTAKPASGARFTPLVQAQVDRLEAATQAGQIDPSLDATRAAQLINAAGSGGAGTLPLHGDATLVGTVKNEDIKGKGKAKEANGEEVDGGEDDGRASSRSTLSVHLAHSSCAEATPTGHRRAASLDSVCSRRSSLGHTAGAGVRAAADAIAHMAAEGARKIRRVGSKESQSSLSIKGEGVNGGMRADWEAEGTEGDERWDRAREREKKERVKKEGKKKVGPLMVKLQHFETTYSRVMLIRQSTREILFCTPELVEHCGLPSSAQFDLTSLDFTKTLFAVTSSTSSSLSPSSPIVIGGADNAEFKAEQHEDEEHTRRLRRNVRLAIEGGHAWTGLVGLKPMLKGGKLFAKHKHGDIEAKVCVLHLTPLCDKDGNCEAFVAVFG